MAAIRIGHYVRAVLAEGLAAALPALEGFDPQLGREGVVVELRPDRKVLTLEDLFGHEHVCHLEGACVVDPSTLDEYIRTWALKRAAELNAHGAPQ